MISQYADKIASLLMFSLFLPLTDEERKVLFEEVQSLSALMKDVEFVFPDQPEGVQEKIKSLLESYVSLVEGFIYSKRDKNEEEKISLFKDASCSIKKRLEEVIFREDFETLALTLLKHISRR